MSSVDTSCDVAIDHEILKRTSDAYRRFRNTFRFLLSELFDFDPTRDAVAVEDLEPLDRLALARMCEVHAAVSDAYAGYRFNGVYRALYDYVVTELSNVYLDVVKDRTYCDAPASRTRRSAQTVLAQILSMLLRDLQPILSYTCDEVFEYLPESMKDGQRFAALLDWYAAPMDEAACAACLPAYNAAIAVRAAVTKALEDARNAKLIGKSQEAAVRVGVPAAEMALIEQSGVDMAELCIVASAELVACDGDEVACEVEAAQGEKCPRCWNVRVLGADGLCCRCHAALAQE